jgi:SHR-binding domain of vacuolar-sorting associated protein 13
VKRAYFVLIYSCEGDEIVGTDSSTTTAATVTAAAAAANTTADAVSDVHSGEVVSSDTTAAGEQLQSSSARPSVVIPDNADSATAAILSAPSTADSVDFADSFSTAVEDTDTAVPTVLAASVTALTVEVPNEHSSDSSATTAAVTASSSTAVTPTAAVAPAAAPALAVPTAAVVAAPAVTATAVAAAVAAAAAAATPTTAVTVSALERLSPVWDTAQHGPIAQCAVPFDSEGRHWSQRFSVNAVSTSGELLTPCAAFGVTIAALPGLYRRTRVVTLYPRFVVRNDLRVPLQVRFNCLNSSFQLFPIHSV